MTHRHTHIGDATIGYGSVSDKQNSSTSSGINTQNLTIADTDKQELLTDITAQAMAEQVFTATTTDTAKALSGALENRFNAQALQKELEVQREVSQEFSRNVQSEKGELNKAADRLKEQYERGELSIADYKATREQLENTSLLLSTIAAGLSAPTNSGLGIAAASLSPVAAKQIGQYFKVQGEQGGAGEGSAQHLIAHGLLAGAVAVAGGNNALSAATSAMTAEAAAPLLANYLYGKDANTLTADEKTTITSITSIIDAGVGASTGSNANIVQSAQSAQSAVEHNQLSTFDIGPIFGVDKWGPGAASLISSGIQEGKSIEEINEALMAYNRGDGFDNGMTDGLMIWAVAPGAGLVVSSPATLPGIGAAAKGYAILAGQSIGSSVVINALTGGGL